MTDDRTRIFRAMGLALPERGGEAWAQLGVDGGIAATSRVLTLDGALPAGQLMIGDRIVTRDSGTASVRWIGRVDPGPARMRAAPAATQARPALRLAPGAFTRDVPFGEVVLAPTARILLRGQGGLPGGDPELLAEAGHLAGAFGIEEVEPPECYLTLHFDRPEIVYVEGLEVASGRPLSVTEEIRRTASAEEAASIAA